VASPASIAAAIIHVAHGPHLARPGAVIEAGFSGFGRRPHRNKLSKASMSSVGMTPTSFPSPPLNNFPKAGSVRKRTRHFRVIVVRTVLTLFNTCVAPSEEKCDYVTPRRKGGRDVRNETRETAACRKDLDCDDLSIVQTSTRHLRRRLSGSASTVPYFSSYVNSRAEKQKHVNNRFSMIAFRYPGQSERAGVALDVGLGDLGYNDVASRWSSHRSAI
jgi:hypothetical protein